MTSVFSMVLTTDVDSVDDSIGIGEDECDNCEKVKVVEETVVDDTVVSADSDGGPHVMLRFPFNPSEIPGMESNTK